MTRFKAPFLAFAVIAFASYARADVLRVLAPADGATLRGGSFAEVRWSAAQLAASDEEWEAFLSIDGGKYYAFRITPHLDIDLRHFTFIVPNVDTQAARILIRTGDEIHEKHFETRGVFSIVRDPHAGIVRELQFGRGESARDGDPAVVAWADGARNGSGLTFQTSTALPSRTFCAQTIVMADGPPVIATAAKRLIVVSVSGDPPLAYEKQVSAARKPISVDLLLICGRLNV